MTLLDDKDPRTHAIIGAAMEVHSILGCGFLEAVYQEALALEFAMRGIPFTRETSIPVFYKGQRLSSVYRADFMCFGTVVIEIKAIDRMGSFEEAQIIHYLKATDQPVGLLLNFGSKKLEFRRFAFSKNTSASSA